MVWWIHSSVQPGYKKIYFVSLKTDYNHSLESIVPFSFFLSIIVSKFSKKKKNSFPEFFPTIHFWLLVLNNKQITLLFPILEKQKIKLDFEKNIDILH